MSEENQPSQPPDQPSQLPLSLPERLASFRFPLLDAQTKYLSAVGPVWEYARQMTERMAPFLEHQRQMFEWIDQQNKTQKEVSEMFARVINKLEPQVWKELTADSYSRTLKVVCLLADQLERRFLLPQRTEQTEKGWRVTGTSDVPAWIGDAARVALLSTPKKGVHTKESADELYADISTYLKYDYARYLFGKHGIKNLTKQSGKKGADDLLVFIGNLEFPDKEDDKARETAKKRVDRAKKLNLGEIDGPEYFIFQVDTKSIEELVEKRFGPSPGMR